jgi:ketosteroid isomerase-like protein
MLSFFKNVLCLSTVLLALSPAPGYAEEPAGSLKIEITGASASDKESGEVLAALQKIFSALERSNFEQVGECLCQDVVLIDERNHQLFYGKDAVLARLKSNIKENKKVTRFVVRDPFINVKGDAAMVSFQASKELEDGSKFESLCSENYERKNGQWLVLKFRSNWKQVR